MALATNIVKRPGSASYYVRVTVPSDLRELYGKRQIWKSLGTALAAEARANAPAIVKAFQDEFTARRRGREIVENDVSAIAWKHYSELIENDERFRDQNLTDEQLDELWRQMEAQFGEYDIGAYQAFAEIRDRIETYRMHRERSRKLLTSGDPNKMLQAVAESVDEHVAAYRAVLPKTSPTYRKVAMGVARAEMEALKRADERDRMDWSGNPTDPLIKRAEQPKAAPAGRLLERYGIVLAPGEFSEMLKDIASGRAPLVQRRSTKSAIYMVRNRRLFERYFVLVTNGDVRTALPPSRALRRARRALPT